jgi:hypothetical protein
MMNPLNLIKMVTIGGFVAVGILWTASSSLSQPAEPGNIETPSSVIASYNADDFVGSESCKACHEAQFVRFAKTQHARVASQPDWKGKMQGCESPRTRQRIERRRQGGFATAKRGRQTDPRLSHLPRGKRTTTTTAASTGAAT